MGYIRKNNFNYCKFFYIVKTAKESLAVHVRKLLFKKYTKNHKIYIYIYIYIFNKVEEKKIT